MASIRKRVIELDQECRETLNPASANYPSLMRRILLDSNAVDPLADLPGAYEAVLSAIESGAMELLFTHVNIDELAEIGDLSRRQHLLLLLVAVGKLVPTGGAAYNYSRYNFSRYTDDPDIVDAVRSGNLDHTRDALLAATAKYEQCAIATNDRRLRNRGVAKGLKVLSTSDLLAEAGYVG